MRSLMFFCVDNHHPVCKYHALALPAKEASVHVWADVGLVKMTLRGVDKKWMEYSEECREENPEHSAVSEL